jgi:hypothetical protein
MAERSFYKQCRTLQVVNSRVIHSRNRFFSLLVILLMFISLGGCASKSSQRESSQDGNNTPPQISEPIQSPITQAVPTQDEDLTLLSCDKLAKLVEATGLSATNKYYKEGIRKGCDTDPNQPTVEQPVQKQVEEEKSCEDLRVLVKKNQSIGDSAVSMAQRGTSPAGTTGSSITANTAFSRVTKYSAQMARQGCSS